MLAIIRVFTTTDPAVLLNHSEKISTLFGLETKTYCIPDQPYGIHDEASERAAVPKIVATALQAERDGAACIFISCAADPGVAEARQAVKIPVLGAGTCAAGIALARGQRIGVLNLTGATPLRPAAALGQRLCAEIAPLHVENTTDLLTPVGQAAAINAAKALAEKADVIMLGCTGFTTIGLARRLQAAIRIPIIDAVEAGGAIAAGIIAAHKSLEKVGR